MYNYDDKSLNEEAEAFDSQILERVKSGHLPDIRTNKECGYFYNNPWRHPDYVKLDFGEQFNLINNTITHHFSHKERSNLRILEVGCGPGYMSLELSRTGCNVVGIDVSKDCIEVAKKTAENDAWAENRGLLDFITGDYFSDNALKVGSFDCVLFLGALHHFTDQPATLRRTSDLLNENGIIMVHEPVRDKVDYKVSSIKFLVQSILSLAGGYYTDGETVGRDRSELIRQIEVSYNAMRYELEDGENVQSINDNEAGFEDMYPILKKFFDEADFKWRYGFFHEVIGGLRFDQDTNAKIARFIREIDAVLVGHDVIPATEFYFVGTKQL